MHVKLFSLLTLFATLALLLAPLGCGDPTLAKYKIAFRVFHKGSDGGQREIFVMNADGSQQQNISLPFSNEIDLAWSPDGSKIVFVYEGEICVMNADGSNRTELTDGRHPVWSPDGTKIAFVLGGICVMNANGTKLTTLIENAHNNHNNNMWPSWSPDGTQIVFVSSMRSDPSFTAYSELYTINADGSDETRLTFLKSMNTRAPEWSPDGTKIAFHSGSEGGNELYSMYNEIYSINADGSELTKLTDSRQDNEYPKWSPDGTKIAFLSNRDRGYNIYVMNADGTGQKRLTNSNSTITVLGQGQFAWCPQSTQ